MSIIKEIETIIGLGSLSEKTKLLVIKELLAEKTVDNKKERIINKSTGWKIKRGATVYNAGKRLTSTEIDTVAREFFINGNKPKKIGKLIGRSTISVGNIIHRLRTGVMKTSVSWKKEKV